MEDEDVDQNGNKDPDQGKRGLLDPECIFALDGFRRHICN